MFNTIISSSSSQRIERGEGLTNYRIFMKVKAVRRLIMKTNLCEEKANKSASVFTVAIGVGRRR